MTQMSFTLYIFHFFSLIYKYGSFLFISYFDGDGRGGGRGTKNQKTVALGDTTTNFSFFFR